MPDGAGPPLLGLSQRQPPSNVQAEQALLGALLANNKAYERVSEFLRPQHFADAIHGRIYQAVARRVEAGQLADAVTLKADFEGAGILEEVGGVAYLGQLLTAMVGIINVGEYGRAIHDAWLRRQLIDLGETVVNNAFGADPEMDAEKQIDATVSAALALGASSGAPTRSVDFGTAAAAAVRRAEAAYRGDAGHARLDTGIPSVDALWRGLWPADLYYLMARSRTGKTPAAMQIARHVAAQLLEESERTGKPPGHVHVFSLEMAADALLTINLAAVTEWTADQIRSGEVSDWKRLDDAAKLLGRLPIIVDDAGEMDLSALSMRARIISRQRRTRFICIDYRELIRRPRDQARMGLPEWIPFLGYQLKALAKALNVPVLALAQINKARDGAESPRPTLTDLPYDGGQAADAVFALHRPELYLGDDPPPPAIGLSAEKQAARSAAWHAEREKARGVTEFLALKRRFGPQGACRLRFDGPRMLLREVAR